jgi:hypothetical protein
MGESNSTALAILGISETLKLLLMAYFTLSASQGKTPEQIRAEIATEWAKFQLRDPGKIPDLPEI